MLKGDNRLVNQLGLTHPQMAKPLFHVWNMMLKEIGMGRLRRFSDIQHFYYNDGKVMMKGEGTKGWQNSIFQDEIQGKFDIRADRPLTSKEKALLKGWYPRLSEKQMAELEKNLAISVLARCFLTILCVMDFMRATPAIAQIPSPLLLFLA